MDVTPNFLKLVLSLIFGCMAPISYADSVNKIPDSFHFTCMNEWMAHVNISDSHAKALYQSFGEQYCACAIAEPFDANREENKIRKLCISRSLLRDLMNDVEDDLGFKEVTLGDINEYCEERWTTVYPQQGKGSKGTHYSFCSCVKSKLFNLAVKASQMTRLSYSARIDEIAKACSGYVH